MIVTLTNRGRALAAALLLAHPFLSSATVINGGNLTTQTWTLANNPYIILGDCTVVAGQTLTIDAGVEVQFASTDSQGAGRNSARVELTVNGTLKVQGTAGLPVGFKGQTASAGSWYGIIFTSTATATMLSYANIEHAINGLVCEAGGNNVQVNGSILSSNATAVVINAGIPVLDGIRVFGNQTAFNISSSGGASLIGSVVHGNALQGVQINSSLPASVTINHCILHGNGTNGVFLGGTANTTVFVKNSIITGHSNGIFRSTSSAGSITTSYSDVWNISSNFVNAVAGANVFSADPLYIDANGADNVFGNADDDLHLRPDSPCGFRADDQTDLGPYVIQRIVIIGFQFIGNDARVSFASVSNKNHQLEYTEDFSGWTNVGSGAPGTGGLMMQTNVGVKTLPKRFYRVRVDY